MKVQAILVPLLLLFTIIDCRRQSRREQGRQNRRNGRRAVRDEASDGDEGTCALEISCTGDKIQPGPVKLPIKGPRGPPGKPGTKGDKGEPGEPGKEAKQSHFSAPVPKVAFFVGLSKNKGPIEKNIDLVFDKIVTNYGGGYDNVSGRFTAPYSGIYSFTVVVAAQGRQKAAVMLLKNDEMVETVWAESIPYWASSSNTAILELTSGDQVWPVLLSRAPYMHGYMYSTFSGFSLYNNEQEEVNNNEKGNVKHELGLPDAYGPP